MSRRIRFACRLLLLGVCGCLMLAPDASAVVLREPGLNVGYDPPGGHSAAQTKPASAETKLLTYHGGAVMTSNTNYALFWAPGGGSEYPAKYISGIETWFLDLAHDSGGLLNTDSILTQYGDSEGGFANYDSHFGGAMIDTDTYGANGCKAAAICLTKAQLEAEVQAYAEAHALPAGLTHEYFVLTPPGVASCFEASGHQCSEGTEHFKYCAYHSFFQVGIATYIYAVVPYDESPECVAESPNNSASDHAISGGLAHEHSESVTDPELTAWYNEKKEEVADKCRSPNPLKELGPQLGTAEDGAPYNEVINGDKYLYQQMWSNERAACEQRVALPPTIKKISPKKGPVAGGTHVTIIGAGFMGTVTVDFGATPGTEVKVAPNSQSLTVVTPAGSGEAVVTVHTEAGVSTGSKKTTFKYKASKGKK